MSSVSDIIPCPNEDLDEECPGDIEVTGTASFSTEHHPYGSTTASEELVEVEVDPIEPCAICGFQLSTGDVEHELLEKAEWGE